jgi:hypothetical protein
MSCERHADAILEHALGEPAPPELEAHLRSCAACREALQRERRLLGGIDGELRDAVSLVPSPAFLPRVRERVAREADARTWTWSRLVPAGAVAATLAIGAWLLQSSPKPPSSAVVRVEPRRETPAPSPAVVEVPRRSEASAVSMARKSRPARSEPEVLVPPGEEAALLRFVATIRAGRVDATALVQEPAPPPPDLGIAPLAELPPLEVKPLTAETNSEGVDQ